MVPQEGDLDPVEVSMIAMGGRVKRGQAIPLIKMTREYGYCMDIIWILIICLKIIYGFTGFNEDHRILSHPTSKRPASAAARRGVRCKVTREK